MEHMEKSQSRRKREGGGRRRLQWWEVNTVAPPDADKLLSSDCCWPPEMAVNSCIILFLHSSFLLPSPPPSFLSSPPFYLSLHLSLCVQRSLMRACFGPWQDLGTDTSAHTKTDTQTMDNACVCVCQRNNQVTICCLSVWYFLECVGVCWFFSHLSWVELLANTHPFVSVCFLLNWLPLSLFSVPHALLHSSQPRYLGKTLTKLPYYRGGNLPETVISSSLVQFNGLVKAVINQLFTQPLFVYYEAQRQ